VKILGSKFFVHDSALALIDFLYIEGFEISPKLAQK